MVARGDFQARRALLPCRILLVSDGARANTRVSRWFAMFAEFVLHRWPAVFGFVVPSLMLSGPLRVREPSSGALRRWL
jgi:hypothetical protein